MKKANIELSSRELLTIVNALLDKVIRTKKKIKTTKEKLNYVRTLNDPSWRDSVQDFEDTLKMEEVWLAEYLPLVDKINEANAKLSGSK